MKLEPPKLRQARLQRQDLWRRARASARTMRDSYPRVEQVHLDLKFIDQGPRPPADQSHTLHPPAQAFFAFPCPYTDCDGQFELTDIVAAALGKSASHADGEVLCSGHRLGTGTESRNCGLRLRYKLSARYQKTAAGAARASA